MIKKFRFKDIKSFLEEENIGVEILDKFDKLFDAAIIFTPIALGPAYLTLLTCLEVKDRLVNIGKSILESINSICKPDYVTRAQQIKYAYALIVYTSYFDALDEILPKKLIKELKKELKDKEFSEFESDNDNNVLLSDYRDIPFSDHIDSYSETINQLNKLYENVSERLLRLIDAKKLEIDINGKFAIDFKSLMTEVNKLAIKNYEAQYLDLASNFNDFAFYVQSLEFQSIQKIVKEQSKRMESIDVGFRKLNALFNSLKNNSINSNSQDAVEELKSTYRKEILKPIIDSEEISYDDESVKLRFPKIVDAFIPQSYKCLSYTKRNMKLEEPEVWNNLKAHNNLDAFFIKYLSNPNSIDNPLIILGHPGSGKSLLTKVISAQLMCDYYTVIRIPLREVNAESSIDMLVENQIRKDSNRPLICGYGGFAKEFSDKPLLIILDGYDELLQAKGEVYSNYLQNVKLFQEHQKDLNRPVRIIVTSRITLIDKAIIPENSTIVRLLEFNEEQQNAWISIWNKENDAYFKYNNVLPFSLPDKSNKSIMELSEQPLLLLMLALYDSEGNSLAKLKNEIKRTQLYNNLIKRFVLRERRRYNGFLDLESNEQVNILNKEMSRLGVVAIGMYNRQTVHIHSNELENDLKFYNLNREKRREVNGKRLNDSDSLLAGFFFIHESKANDEEYGNEGFENAYEFLHNTFGEFLTADFILNCAIKEISKINTFKNTPDLNSELLKLQTNESWLNKEWYSCLMFTPLYTRTVVLEMMKEHKAKIIKVNKLDEAVFCDCLKFIVENELKKILYNKCYTGIMFENNLFNRDISLLECLAVYTMNLIILASVLCPDGFKFDENNYVDSYEPDKNISSWRKLCSLWRSCFSEKDLMGLSSIFNANRIDESSLQIISNNKFESMPYKNPIDISLCVSFALSETLNVGLTGLHSKHLLDVLDMNDMKSLEYYKHNCSDLYISLLISILRTESNKSKFDCKKINEIIRMIIRDVNVRKRYYSLSTIIELFEILELCAKKKYIYIDYYEIIIRFFNTVLRRINCIFDEIDSLVECGYRIFELLDYNNCNHSYLGLPRFSSEWAEIHNLEYDYNYIIHKNRKRLHLTLDLDYYSNKEFYTENISDISKIAIIDSLFVVKDMDIWLKTNPEYIAKSLRFYSFQYKFSREYYDVLQLYLVVFCGIFHSNDYLKLSYKTIIDSIIIAKNYDKYSDSTYTDIITENVNKLFLKNFEYFLDTFVNVPLFICHFIDFAPNALKKFNVAKLLGNLKFINELSSVKIYDNKYLIRAIRMLIGNKSRLKENDQIILAKSLSKINREFQIDDMKDISISQLKDLLWVADVIDDQHFKMQIQHIIKSFFEI